VGAELLRRKLARPAGRRTAALTHSSFWSGMCANLPSQPISCCRRVGGRRRQPADLLECRVAASTQNWDAKLDFTIQND